jgi:hypothetical protein
MPLRHVSTTTLLWASSCESSIRLKLLPDVIFALNNLGPGDAHRSRRQKVEYHGQPLARARFDKST